MACTVHSGSLIHFLGNRIEGIHHHNAEHGVGAAGNNQCPAGTDPAQGADDHIGGNHTTAEEHGEHDQCGDDGLHLGIPAQCVAGGGCQNEAQGGGGHRIDDGVQIAADNACIPEDMLEALEVDLTDGQQHQTLVGQQLLAVGDGGHQHMPHGNDGTESNQCADRNDDHIHNPVRSAGGFHHVGNGIAVDFLLSHDMSSFPQNRDVSLNFRLSALEPISRTVPTMLWNRPEAADRA